MLILVETVHLTGECQQAGQRDHVLIGGGGALGLDPGKLGLGIDHIKGSGEPLTECLVTQPHVLLGQRLG